MPQRPSHEGYAQGGKEVKLVIIRDPEWKILPGDREDPIVVAIPTWTPEQLEFYGRDWARWNKKHIVMLVEETDGA